MKRRSFLKLSALAGVSLQANSMANASKTLFDQRKVFCANRFGPFYANVVSGKITSIEPFEGDRFPTTLNNAIPDAIQNESRVLYPCVRKSYLEKRVQTSLNLEAKRNL